MQTKYFKKSVVILLASLMFVSSCATKKTISDDDFAIDSQGDLSLDTGSSQSEGDLTLDFDSSDIENEIQSDIENEIQSDKANSSSQSSASNENTNNGTVQDEFAAFEESSSQSSSQDGTGQGASSDLSQNNEPSNANNMSNESIQGTDTPPLEPVVLDENNNQGTNEVATNGSSSTGNSLNEETSSLNTSVVSSNEVQTLKNVRFVPNEQGGALVLDGLRQMEFVRRYNAETGQLVLELRNVIVPERLKRPLNMVEMNSTLARVDVYQSRNSNVARFVIQLKEGAEEPLVQPEGVSVMVVGGLYQSMQDKIVAEKEQKASEGLLDSGALEDFLTNNNKFYGREISIETTDMDIRDILKFISEESGINMIFDENVSGKMSLKLRKVPWDQALVTILKAKGLGYTRQGQVLRIALIDTLTKEENEAVKLKQAKMKIEPLIVKNFNINYADVTELENKVREFIKDSESSAPAIAGAGAGSSSLSQRGKVTADVRTNTLIVTEVASKMNQVQQLVELLDIPPQQVLIEGRVVEASESYGRSVGVNFGLNTGDLGSSNPLNINGSSRYVTNLKNSGSPLNMSPSMTFTPSATGAFNGSLWFGRLGSFGDLSTRLALDETEDKVRILSSPRVATLHNKKATIKQGSVVQVVSSESVSAIGTPIQTFKEVEVGVILNVKPLISNVGTVNLELGIERSAATSSGERTLREVQTNIIVQNGDTAVIGGVFTSDVNNKRSGIPGLKDIPILGTLFRSDSTSKAKTELIFFISPKIIKDFSNTLKAASPSSSNTETTAE